jgi:hypothetical protein
MNQEDYIKQLEESNKKLQEKLEASEQKHDDFLDKPVYIYMDGNSRSFDNISFRDKNGVFDGELRIVTTMRYIEKDERMFGDDECSMYEQMWEVDQSGNHKWMTKPNIKLNISSLSIKAKPRKLKARWTQETVDDLKSIGNLGDIDIFGIEDSIKEEVDKILHPIKKPTAKEVARYGRKKKHVK